LPGELGEILGEPWKIAEFARGGTHGPETPRLPEIASVSCGLRAARPA
jgi:hypothetical protein